MAVQQGSGGNPAPQTAATALPSTFDSLRIPSGSPGGFLNYQGIMPGSGHAHIYRAAIPEAFTENNSATLMVESRRAQGKESTNRAFLGVDIPIGEFTRIDGTGSPVPRQGGHWPNPDEFITTGKVLRTARGRVNFTFDKNATALERAEVIVALWQALGNPSIRDILASLRT